MSDARFCFNGHALPPDAGYCPRCGAPAADPAPMPPAPGGQPVYGVPVPPTPGWAQPAQPTQGFYYGYGSPAPGAVPAGGPQPKRQTLAIVIGGLVVVAAIAIIATVVLVSRSSSTDRSSYTLADESQYLDRCGANNYGLLYCLCAYNYITGHVSKSQFNLSMAHNGVATLDRDARATCLSDDRYSSGNFGASFGSGNFGSGAISSGSFNS